MTFKEARRRALVANLANTIQGMAEVARKKHPYSYLLGKRVFRSLRTRNISHRQKRKLKTAAAKHKKQQIKEIALAVIEGAVQMGSIISQPTQP